MEKLRLLSLCSGIGVWVHHSGADLAAEWTGAIEVVGQVEIDTFCQSVLSKYWPHVARMSDIKNVQGDEFGRIDLVAGGIPCQPFSSAGKQHGADDDRYLWPEMFRIVQRCHPAWVVIENVDDFTYMALEVVQADLESQDYAVQAFVLPACAVGAPHIRERCFVVVYSNRLGESGQKSAVSDGQRSTIESTSIRQRTNTTHMADSTCSRETVAQQPRQRCSPEQSSEDMVHANIGQCAGSTQARTQTSARKSGTCSWHCFDPCIPGFPGHALECA